MHLSLVQVRVRTLMIAALVVAIGMRAWPWWIALNDEMHRWALATLFLSVPLGLLVLGLMAATGPNRRRRPNGPR